MKKLIVGIAICLFGFICVNTVFAEPYYMSMNMCIELDEDDTFTLYEDGEKIGVYEYACGEYDEEGDKITYMELYEDEDPGVVIMRYKSLTGNGVPTATWYTMMLKILC